MIAALRRYLITGLVVLVPILVTVVVVTWLIEMGDKVVSWLPPAWRPDVLLGRDIPGFGVALSLLAIMLIGALATNVVGRYLLGWFDVLLARVPVVRSVYGAAKQLMEAVLGKGSKAFREVVLVSFPQPGQWTIGFVTNDSNMPIPGGSRVAVFIPTTPNPTSGWLIYAAREHLIPLDISVEEGMKIVVSGGMINPRPGKAHQGIAESDGR